MHSSICSLTPLQIILSSFFGSIRRKYCVLHPTQMSSLDVGDIQIRKRLDLICPNASLCPNSCWTWGSHWKYKTPVWNNSAVMKIPKDIISAVGFHSLYMRILLVGMFLWQSIILSSPKNTTFFLPTKSFLQAVEGHFAACFSSAGLLYVGFSACMFGLYSFMPVVIKKTSATAVNLSLLTADLYSLFCGLFLFHYKVCGNQRCIWGIAVCLKKHQCRTRKQKKPPGFARSKQ